MKAESLTITIPIPNRVLSPNCAVGSIGGRFMKAAAAKKLKRIVREAIEAEQIETMPWGGVDVAVTFYWATNRKRDQDNAVASLKAAYDGITDSGLVPDDNPVHMHRNWPAFEVDRSNPRVVMTLERVY
jgi:Holliday junction resolvase RusA-like endonuclease